jgi:hypothetical protein
VTLPGTRSPDVDAIIEGTSDGRGPILARLREIIHEADPAIVEVVKWRKPSSPLGAAVFEHAGVVCILIPLKGRVRASFPAGARLPDPKNLFNAQLSGVSRAIDFAVDEPIDAPGVKTIIRADLKLRLEKVASPSKAAAKHPSHRKGRR